MSKKKSGSAFGLALIFGAIIGYLIGLFIPDKTRKKQQQEINQKAQALKKFVTDPKERERVKQIFDKNTQKARQTYRQTREYLVANLEKIKGTLVDIDKDKYTKAVNQALDQIKKEQLVPTKQLAKIKTFLVEDFKLLTQKKKPSRSRKAEA